MSSNSSSIISDYEHQGVHILAAVAEEYQEYQDITDEVDVFEDDTATEDDEESVDELSLLLEYAPAELEGVPGWIGRMEYGERQYWDQFVRDMTSYENALVTLGFTHEDVQAFMAESER